MVIMCSDDLHSMGDREIIMHHHARYLSASAIFKMKQQHPQEHQPTAPHSAALSHCSHHQRYERWPPHKPPRPITQPHTSLTTAITIVDTAKQRPAGHGLLKSTALRISITPFLLILTINSHSLFSNTVVFPRFLH